MGVVNRVQACRSGRLGSSLENSDKLQARNKQPRRHSRVYLQRAARFAAALLRLAVAADQVIVGHPVQQALFALGVQGQFAVAVQRA